MQNVCYNCFHYAPEGRACPYCGYDPRENEDKYLVALKPGTPLANRYLVGRVLGQGGFGITYVAFDDQTKSRVAVKEYMPTDFAFRDEGTVNLKLTNSRLQEDFEYGKQQFLQEARTLAEFVGNEHIIGIRDMFEANGTAYFAMEYAEGVNLKQYMLQKGGPLQVYEANRILLPIMEALQWVHSKGIVHRDIAPDNIMIRSDGKAKLIDFGAARYSTGEKSRSLDVVLKHGFAPYEQYSRRGRQGPFTDVYALAATYYYAVTGKVPPDAVDRMDQDTLRAPSAYGVRIRRETEAVLAKALAVSSRDRWQTMAEFYTALLNSMPEPFAPETAAAEPQQPVAARERPQAVPGSGTRSGEMTGKNDRSQTAVQPEKKEKTQASPKPERAPEKASEKTDKKKLPIIAIAAVAAVCILVGVLFGTGALGKKNDFTKAGSIVTFGAYEQDNNLSNGKEPIEWIVLDVQDGKSLLISRYGLDCRRYNSIHKAVTWEKSSLRYWLNSDFLTYAFTEEERACIPAETVTAYHNPKYSTAPGKATNDGVFLLSIQEAETYFSSADDMKCEPTAFAEERGCKTGYSGSCPWWLRSPAYTSYEAAYIDVYGAIYYSGTSVDTDSLAIRPAIWINLK